MTEKKDQSISIHDYMEYQPIENIGLIGHVSNGKSSIVRQISGVATQKHSHEQDRNITIKLGYANAKIFKCKVCVEPYCYDSASSETKNKYCNHCDSEMSLIRHVSFVDNPGHNSFMSTMLNGNAVMKWAITVESLQNNTLPAPQTIEHLKAIEVAGLKSPIVCINKMDLIAKKLSKDDIKLSQENAIKKIQEIKNKCKDTPIDNAVYIPLSASMGINLNYLLKYIVKQPLPVLELNVPFEMPIIRSFNVNKSNSPIETLQGGVVGGSIIKGMITKGDKIVIMPGFINKNPKYGEKTDEGEIKWRYHSLKTEVISINSEKTKLIKAISGGLIGIMTNLDPSLVTDDGLVGNIVIPEKEEKNYGVYECVIVKFEPLNESIKIKKEDQVSINCNGGNSRCNVIKVSKNGNIGLELLTRPICGKIGSVLTISTTDNENTMKILGRGIITKGMSSINF